MARKINVKLILELRDAHMSRNDIASTRHMSRNSVSDVFHIADEKGITYQDVRSLGDNEAYDMFFPEKHATEDLYADPVYSMVHEELKKVGVTLKLLWEEYKEQCSTDGTVPMGYTKYCEGYQKYTAYNNLTSHLEHRPGERCEVDWSGPKMSYVDTATGEEISVYLFVAALPYSQYSYVEPCLDMKMDTFIRCHVHMYDYFGGVPTRTICDNLKTGVVSHPREGDILLTADYEALGLHYVTAIMPAPVRSPKAKASVEGTVGKIATAIIARLRNELFTSFGSLKESVLKKLYDFNHEDFQKRSDGSRYDAWLEEKKYLRPAPDVPYEIASWDYGHKVAPDSHIAFETNRYSVPYQFAKPKTKVDLRITDTKVEIYRKGELLTTHGRLYCRYGFSTNQEDMPERLRDKPEWDQERICHWALSIGPNTREVINRIFCSVDIKEQGYNPSLSVLRLSRSYSDARLETACELAVKRGVRSPRYHHLKAILAANQDLLYQEGKAAAPVKEDISGSYLRGSEYYEKGGCGNAE